MIEAVLDCCSRAFDVVLAMGGGTWAFIDSARSLEFVVVLVTVETLFERDDDEVILVIVFLREEAAGSDKSNSMSSSVSCFIHRK